MWIKHAYRQVALAAILTAGVIAREQYVLAVTLSRRPHSGFLHLIPLSLA